MPGQSRRRPWLADAATRAVGRNRRLHPGRDAGSRLGRPMIGAFKLAALLLPGLGVLSPAVADDAADCRQTVDLDLRIRACTSLIQSGTLQGLERADAHNRRGQALFLQQEYDRAISNFTRAIKIAPGFAIAHNNRGFVHYTVGDLDQAIADFDAAIRARPNYARAYYNRGTAYHASGDLDRAIADYDAAIRADPGYGNAYVNRSHAHRQKGDIDRAAADCDRARQVDPGAAC